jgi:hypothetical protein
MAIASLVRAFRRFCRVPHQDNPMAAISKRFNDLRSFPTIKLTMNPHAMSIKPSKSVLLWLTIHSLVAAPVQAELFSLSASGRITLNSTADSTIPVGTPWTFEIIYNTAAPDLDFELKGAPDSTFGRFTNSGAIPAVTFFHYRAGTYEVTLDEPADFDLFSNIDITFLGGVHAIDINVFAAGLFPPLGGGAVSFHADFNDSTHSALMSDGLPANQAIGLQSFQESSVTLLPPNGVILGSGADMTSLRIAPVPEPSTSAAAIIGGLGLLLRRRPRSVKLGLSRPSTIS